MRSYQGINAKEFLKEKVFLPMLRKWQNEKILLVAILAISLLITGLGVFSTQTLKKAINNLVNSELQQTTLIVKVSAQTIFDALADELLSEASSQSIKNSLSDYQFGESNIRPQLASIIEAQPTISKLVLLDSAGRSIAYSGMKKINGDDNTATPKKITIPENQELIFENDRIALIRTPVFFTPSNKNEGVLEATVSLDSVKENILKHLTEQNRKNIILRFNNYSKTEFSKYVNLRLIETRASTEIHFQLLGNFSKNSISAFYWEDISEQIYSIFLTMLINIIALSSTWVVFFIFFRWANIKYVNPINKITRATRVFLNSTAKLPNSKFNDNESAVKQLQDSVMMAMRSFNVNELAYQDQIKNAWLEIESTRQRLEMIATNSGIIAFSINLASGLIEYATKSADENLKPLFPLAGSQWRDAIKRLPRYQRLILLQCIKSMKRNAAATAEITISTNGKNKIYQLRFCYASNQTGDLIRLDCTAIDDTNNVVVKKALLESERRKSAIVNGAIEGLLILDSNLLIIDVNPAAEKLFNQSNLQLLGKSFLDRCVAADHQGEFISIAEKLKNNNLTITRSIDDPLWCKDKNQIAFPVKISASLVSSDSGSQICLYLNDLRDIYRKKNEIAQKVSQIEMAFSLSPDGFAAFNESNILSSFNEALQNLFENLEGQFCKGMTHEKFWTLIESISLKPQNKLVLARLKSGEEVLQLDTEKPKLIKFSKRTSSKETFLKSTIYYFTDITSEYQLDVMKNNFLATAAHELRTPLTTIQGFSELLTKKSLPLETQNDLLGSINRQSLKLSALVNDLLDLAKIDAEGIQGIKLANHDLREIIETLLSNVSIKSNDKIFYENTEIITDFDSSIPLIASCVPEKIYRVINNLLSNSVKYNKNNNPIILKLRKTETQKGQSIEISVIDSGIGMSKRELNNAFVRFWRADHNSGSVSGTGLGLSLVKEIIEMHGGGVHLDSTLGKGTTATIILPAPPPPRRLPRISSIRL